MASNDDDEKSEEATPKRLADARKKGQIVYSAEVGTAFSLLGVTAFVAFMAGPMIGGLGGDLAGALSNAHNVPIDGGSMLRLFAQLSMEAAAASAFAVGSLVLLGIVSRYVQDKPAWSAERLKPKIEHINPFEGVKRVFGPQAFGQFFKAAVKVAVVGAAVLWTLWPRDGSLSMMAMLDPSAILALIKERTLALLIACTLATAAIALADYVFTNQAHKKRMRMSRRELKEEYKQSEGDPHVRARLRQIRSERARRRMMTAVPQATVIITNPTHYAVALKYDHDETPAPIVVAKGVNDIALKIREIATAHDVPIIEDPPLARALYAHAEIDQQIPREHFEAVAKIIGVVLRLSRRKQRRQ
jgi:flagellar biosynthetic protein FlhB